MRIFLPLLCAVCAAVARGIFDGTCPRKDPPPGALVISPGSDLVLTCSGHVAVDGVKVRNGSNTNRRGSSSAATPTTVNIITSPGVQTKSDTHATENAVSQGYRSNPTEAGDERSLSHTDTGYTASPTAHTGQPTSVRRLLNTAETDAMDYKGEEGSRVTRGIKSRSQWMLNKRTLGKGDRDRGGITFDRSGGSLSLSSVRLTDSGTYACFHGGRERFSLKVIVAVKMSCGGEEVRKESCEQQETETFTHSQELLMKVKEYLEKRIDRELLNVKKNSRENRRVALQALREKKWCEKHLTYIDCAVKAMKSTNEHILILNKVNELLKDIREEGTQNLCTPVNFGVECDEDELLAELERLEKNLEETPLQTDRTEERVSFLTDSSTASLSNPAKMEEDEVEEQLQYLWRWLNESS